MIKFFKNNKILFIVGAIIIIGGACLAAILMSNVNVAMAQEQIKTAVAESNAAAAPATSVSETAVKTASEVSQTPSALSAGALRYLVEVKETRRNHVIPCLDCIEVNEATTWQSIRPSNFMQLKESAFVKTVNFAKEFFGYTISDANINFWYYTDTDKKRGDLVKVATLDDAIVCTFAADTLDLMEIDYYFIPVAASKPVEDDQISSVSDSERRTADKIAASLSTSVSEIKALTQGGYNNETLERFFWVRMANGKFIKFATLNDNLYAVEVYPTEACWNEAVYFEADVQYDPSIVKLVSPQNFEEGQPGNGDMTQDEAKKIYLSFLNLANGTSNYPDPAKMTFYIDHSGARENYWHIEGDKLSMDLSSKSKWLLSLTCSDLWNSAYDVPGIERKGYSDYINNIMRGIYGSNYKGVRENAVYDGGCCTEDALMADGTLYEFMFKGGTLQKVDCFANEDCFKDDESGWKADHLYINSTTGKEFIPEN